MRAKSINEVQNFERRSDPKASMGIGAINNPHLLLEKFIQDFKKEFGIKLTVNPCGHIFNAKKEEDIICFKPSDQYFIIERLLHTEWGEGLYMVLSEEAATRLFQKPTKPGWFIRHQSPSSSRSKEYYLNNTYFLPEVLKRLQRLKKWDFEAMIERRNEEISQIEKLSKIL